MLLLCTLGLNGLLSLLQGICPAENEIHVVKLVRVKYTFGCNCSNIACPILPIGVLDINHRAVCNQCGNIAGLWSLMLYTAHMQRDSNKEFMFSLLARPIFRFTCYSILVEYSSFCTPIFVLYLNDLFFSSAVRWYYSLFVFEVLYISSEIFWGKEISIVNPFNKLSLFSGVLGVLQTKPLSLTNNYICGVKQTVKSFNHGCQAK